MIEHRPSGSRGRIAAGRLFSVRPSPVSRIGGGEMMVHFDAERPCHRTGLGIASRELAEDLARLRRGEADCLRG